MVTDASQDILEELEIFLEQDESLQEASKTVEPDRRLDAAKVQEESAPLGVEEEWPTFVAGNVEEDLSATDDTPRYGFLTTVEEM